MISNEPASVEVKTIDGSLSSKVLTFVGVQRAQSVLEPIPTLSAPYVSKAIVMGTQKWFSVNLMNTEETVGLIWFRPCGTRLNKWTIASVAYAMSPDFEGLGLTSQALPIALETMRNKFGVSQFEAKIALSNTRSKRLVQSCGFILTGCHSMILMNGNWWDYELWSSLCKG